MDTNYFESMESRLAEIERIISENHAMSRDEKYRAYLKEHGTILPAVNKYKSYKALLKRLSELEGMLADGEIEQELKQLGEEEKAELKSKIETLEKELAQYVEETKRGKAINSIIVEIRAGAGGDESAIFAADLFRMYTRYAEKKGYKIELIDAHDTGLKGFKEVIFGLEGRRVYDDFRYESGTHRVQRIPVTEASGRIHTSTATVSVMPEPEAVEMNIKPEELKIEFCRASGHGGQHLQKTESAARIVHIPTGIEAQCQDERSQLRNKEKAFKLLLARVNEFRMNQQTAEISQKRRQQIGGAKRSEKIRTYNFPQNRVTDHRINVSLHKLKEIIDGDLDELIKELRTRAHQEITYEDGEQAD